jgi:hypothetical protein
VISAMDEMAFPGIATLLVFNAGICLGKSSFTTTEPVIQPSRGSHVLALRVQMYHKSSCVLIYIFYRAPAWGCRVYPTRSSVGLTTNRADGGGRMVNILLIL